MSDTAYPSVNDLTLEEKASLTSGGDAWHLQGVETKGIPGYMITDGPHGLRKSLASSTGETDLNDSVPATCFPTASAVANSWDAALGEEIGAALGEEAAAQEVAVLLGPGLNTKRSPLCGRNFEYFSEDPYLSGKMAASYVRGIQSNGISACPKHFAVNSQELRRMASDSVVDERTLRELYLTGFEIVVKEAKPKTIMTSYNLINGVHAANCYDTCTKAARDEWGFAGAIMTDWTTTNVQIQGECTAAGCMRAGNDMVMPGLPEDHENIKKELADGTLTMAELKRCIYNTVNIVLQSNMYEGAVSYLDQFDDLDTYLVVK